MNQKTLEGAVRRIGADPTLEPARKAYLMQHIMASRYIVAQQQGKARFRPPPPPSHTCLCPPLPLLHTSFPHPDPTPPPLFPPSQPQSKAGHGCI